MKKSVLCFSIFLTMLLFSTDSMASKRVSTKNNKAYFGCGSWQPIQGRGGAVIGEWRECTNIFGRSRLQIVHFV